MAGNLVKWWKHKILGGYKQFSVPECTTDSEELMYHQVRASSSCSAPPDLLLVSDRENNMPLATEATNIIGAATTPPSTGANACPVLSAGNNNQKLLHQHQQLKPQQSHAASYYSSTKEAVGRHQKVVGSRQVQPDLQHQMHENEGQVEPQQNFSSNTRHAQHHQQRSEEHIRLEEFTCDVSVEGGKSSQPLQFSFTFYDLDGHHGKITKDDIVGIVYTIYESIGKSVVVPHSGSKTINVRLTVSPEGKSKTAKAKKQPNVATQKDAALASTRRLHRYRPRKLIKSDEDVDDSNSDKEREDIITTTHGNNGHNILNKPSRSSRVNKTKTDLLCCQQPQVPTGVDVNNHERLYEPLQTEGLVETCRECLAAVEETRKAVMSPTHNNPTTATQFHGKSMTNEAYLKNVASTRMKMLRKSRKQKYQDCSEMRQRSLSVGNETCWNNRHLQKSSHPHQQQCTAVDQQLNNTDVLDGVQLRSSLRAGKLQMSQKRNSAECWKTALNRNDLISIIRESMEKNRLCFQLNGKPQANVSPIRQSSHQQHQLQSRQAQHHRQRSNTGSKIPMLIANHNHRSNSFTNNNDTSRNDYQNSSSNIYHLQPHIPIYHQQIPINPAVVATQTGGNTGSSATGSAAGHHSKMNLCGYDSFLHATICGGGLSHSPPPHTSSNSQPGATVNSHHSNQQIATVQPIMSSVTANSQSASKHTGISMTPNQVRTCKILRSGSYSQTQQTAFASTQNSPQYHGYQRLSSNNKQNLSTLNLERTQTDMSGKWRKEHVKNYDQLLYAKLTEKLQQTNLATTNKENVQRKRHRVLRHRRASTTIAQANKMCIPPVSSSKSIEYSTLIPVDGDLAECENLIVQTSDDESHSHHDMAVKEVVDVNIDPSSRRHVAEGTLVDLDDVCKHDPVDTVQHVISKDILGLETDDNGLHVNDDLGIDGELEEDLADLEEIGVAESGRNSVVSMEENEDIVANANGANTSATSSLIHRYVHEHIHHHYHHFEDKDE